MKSQFKKPDWANKTVVCLASGPSLTKEDCELVKASGHPVAVTNTTFRMAPWADVVFGMDVGWWKVYHTEAKSICTGRLMSTSHAARSYGVETLYREPWFSPPVNSGAAIIKLAMVCGANKVVMLGYDCQMTNGKSHWHGDHEKGLGNASSIKVWPKHFAYLAKEAAKADCDVVNASRQTALTCFRTLPLQQAL